MTLPATHERIRDRQSSRQTNPGHQFLDRQDRAAIATPAKSRPTAPFFNDLLDPRVAHRHC
jgi:hypothetical protein